MLVPVSDTLRYAAYRTGWKMPDIFKSLSQSRITDPKMAARAGAEFVRRLAEGVGMEPKILASDILHKLQH